MADQYIRLINRRDPSALTVCRLTGLAPSTIYEKMQAGSFPKPYKVRGLRVVVWKLSEIERWQRDTLEPVLASA